MNFKKIFERLQKAWIFSSLLSIVLGIILLFFPWILVRWFVICWEDWRFFTGLAG